MNLSAVWNELYEYTIILPLIPLCLYPVADHFKSSFPVLIKKIILGVLGSFAIFVTFDIILNIDITNAALVAAALYMGWIYHREVDLPISKKLFVVMTVSLCCAFALLFATIIDYFLYPTSNYYSFSEEALWAQVLFLVFLNIVLYYPFRKYLGWVISNFHDSRVWKTIWILPLVFIPILGIILPQDYENVYAGRTEYLYPIIMSCVFIMSIVIYILFYRIIYSLIKTQELEQRNKILDIQSSQYQQLLHGVQENSRIRHDFKHQLVVISELLKKKDYEQLEQYVHDYVTETKTDIHVYSYSPAVNAVLSYYEALCQSKHISTQFSFHVPDQIPLSDQDACVILGNLLENAVYACEKAENPYIQLKVGHTAVNILALKISNPYIGTLKQKDGVYQSSRHETPALGLESIRTIAEKYNGVMEILTEDQIFTVKILLQFPEA